MITTFLNWFSRRKRPTLKEITHEAIATADTMNRAMRELAECDCTDHMRKLMDRARRMQGQRTRNEDAKR